MLPYLCGLALFCFVLERAVPGWRLPKVRTWPVRVVVVNLVQLGVVLLAGITWERWLSRWSVFIFTSTSLQSSAVWWPTSSRPLFSTGGIGGVIALMHSGWGSIRSTIARNELKSSPRSTSILLRWS